ncbi:hypothetical protein V1504DRAFT_470912 [Lipomyces starkeyi]
MDVTIKQSSFTTPIALTGSELPDHLSQSVVVSSIKDNRPSQDIVNSNDLYEEAFKDYIDVSLELQESTKLSDLSELSEAADLQELLASTDSGDTSHLTAAAISEIIEGFTQQVGYILVAFETSLNCRIADEEDSLTWEDKPSVSDGPSTEMVSNASNLYLAASSSGEEVVDNEDVERHVPESIPKAQLKRKVNDSSSDDGDNRNDHDHHLQPRKQKFDMKTPITPYRPESNQLPKAKLQKQPNPGHNSLPVSELRKSVHFRELSDVRLQLFNRSGYPANSI